jgi:hypothetical protein
MQPSPKLKREAFGERRLSVGAFKALRKAEFKEISRLQAARFHISPARTIFASSVAWQEIINQYTVLNYDELP